MEPIFPLEEIFFRNRLLSCAATVTMSCRASCMQNFTPANKNVWLVKTLSSHFSDVAATKSNFPSSEDIIFSESLILASGNLFLSSGNSILLFRAIFQLFEIRGNQF